MPLHPQAEPQANNSVCPRCGTQLRCGNIAGDAHCWCSQLPNIMPVPPAPGALSAKAALAADANSNAASFATPDETSAAASCLCPACLKQITDERLHAS